MEEYQGDFPPLGEHCGGWIQGGDSDYDSITLRSQMF